MFALVVGSISFLMIFLVSKGKTILGKLNFPSTPYSEILKNTLFGLAKSLEEPMFPFADNSNVSALLNKFLHVNAILPLIPNSCTSEVVTSIEGCQIYFGLLIK